MILLTSKSYSQFWPIDPLIRYGNVIYYELDNEDQIDLTEPQKIFDKKIENRFFDILTKQDSIGLKMDGKVFYFSQKSRREPTDQKNIIFYSRRLLQNENAKIKYLEIKEIQDEVIIAEATVKYKGKGKKKELVEIYLSDVEGLFIGPGEKQRTATYVLSWGAGLGAGIYLFSR